MQLGFHKSQLALAAVAALSTLTLTVAPGAATAAGKAPGQYVTGDFHNHTTCSDGSISMQKLVKKVTDKASNGGDTPWGLDWFVQAGHGGNGNRNCTLVEDATLATPAYPYNPAVSPQTTWVDSGVTVKGDVNGSGSARNMWRWQSLQEIQYPLLEYLNASKNLPLFIGMESVGAGHEHISMSVITGQMPASIDSQVLPTAPGYKAIGNADALAQWSYCFDRNDTDTSRGNTTGTAIGNNWNCAVPGSNSTADANWSTKAQKLTGNNGVTGHLKTLEALKWMVANHATGSYYVPAHLERAGPFNTAGSNGFNIEHLRDFNNTAPNVSFGFETQPGHGASSNRGEYQVLRNNFGSGVGLVDSVGGTTYGGTGIYGAQVGGVWDALLGEGRNWWYFASSDWHNRGAFGPDDRRSTQDFYPGEYARDFVMVRNNGDKLRPQTIVDGLRTGNSFVANGQLIDRLGFVACYNAPGAASRSEAFVTGLAVAAATGNTDTDLARCATMGEKLVMPSGMDVTVAIVVRDPEGTNYSPYTFPNPSLAQIGKNVPINQPVLDHVDVIRGLVTGYKTPGSADYAGEWPRNTAWLKADGTTTGLSAVPAAAKNLSAAVIKTFNADAGATWTKFIAADGKPYLKMSFTIKGVKDSQYVRLRGTNLPASVPYETDPSGNPLADVYTNANDTTRLAIPCRTPHSAGNQFDGCPDHLATATGASPIAGQKAVSFDVAAWSDLWFYSNPIYVQVNGSTTVAGVR